MWVRPTGDPSRAVVFDPATKRQITSDGVQVSNDSFEHLRMVSQRDLEIFTPVSSGSSEAASGGAGSTVSSGATILSGGSGSTSTGSVTSGGTIVSGGSA